ncbi:hypothetical protein HBA54_18035 [Pelagibius litoralis]|uniref:Uncharacterized protein n=1 Tax=Pelagibius litoralis TaxID=374515 RepID=A0A967KBR2_9PROT|nr:hypothetical protein [Pelagibius litoralis]NIA70499.1 hypothetical protein [Pelagibius litoralis]
MPTPLNIIDLAITEEISGDSAEVARRLDKAADLVEGFAEQSGLDALDQLLSIAEKTGVQGSTIDLVEAAQEVAKEVTGQSGVLHREVERFISVSSER